MYKKNSKGYTNTVVPVVVGILCVMLVVYIAVAGQAGTRVTRNVFAGDRQQVRWASTEKALSMVKDYLEEV